MIGIHPDNKQNNYSINEKLDGVCRILQPCKNVMHVCRMCTDNKHSTDNTIVRGDKCDTGTLTHDTHDMTRMQNASK